jgi:hypothetical protein
MVKAFSSEGNGVREGRSWWGEREGVLLVVA